MPKRPRRALAFALALGIWTGFAPLGFASVASAGMPTERVRGFFHDVNRIIADPIYDDRLADRIAALRALLADIVDFRSAAAAALGSEWAARSAQERDEFVRLFTDLLQTSVVGSVGARARLDGGGVAVSYLGERADGAGATVATTVLTRSGEPMGVGYRMSPRSGRWLVYDVVVDGVSLVENYRAQFQKVMHRSSYAALVGEMRTRIVELGRLPVTPTPAAAASVPPVRAAAASDGAQESPTAPIAAAPTAMVVSAASPAERLVPDPRSAPVPERRPVETRSPDLRQVEPRVAESRPPESRPPESRPLESRPPESRPLESRPLESRPPESRPPAPLPRMEARLTEPRITPPSAVTPPAPAPRAGAPAYWVQVGAFRTNDRALRLANEFRGEAVSVVTVPGEPPMMRVVVGPFSQRRAAAAKLREFLGRGYSAFIRDTVN
jgi:phospholipid transport system substrate-binding protein